MNPARWGPMHPDPLPGTMDGPAPAAEADGGAEKPGGSRLVRVVWLAAALTIVATVTAAFLRYHIPGYGFTYVFDFGDSIGLRHLPELSQVPVFIHQDVAGYDGQMYAQLALRPAARDPALTDALDNAPYRACRTMMGWVSWIVGLGRPAAVLNVHACLNLAVWLALAGLLLRWFRPVGGHDFVRWCGVLLSAGMLSSLRHALTDGPMLLALAGMMALLESGHRWGAAALGAVAGLTRETGVLGGVALAPASWRDGRGWLRAALQGALMVLPLLLWMLHVQALARGEAVFLSGSAGRNLTWPFAGYVERTLFLVGSLLRDGWRQDSGAALLFHVGLTVQAAWIVARPRWPDPWWRIGMINVVLLAFLDTAVWEGYPGASARVLLPMVLAFNVIVPRRSWGLLLLLAGNLGVFAGLTEMRPPLRPMCLVSGPGELRYAPALGTAVGVDFEEGFFLPERQRSHLWRWSTGEGTMRLRNRHAFPVEVRVSLGLRAVTPREVAIEASGRPVWSGEATPDLRMLTLPVLDVPPGGLELRVLSGPGVSPGADTRSLSVAVYDVSLDVTRVE